MKDRKSSSFHTKYAKYNANKFTDSNFIEYCIYARVDCLFFTKPIEENSK